MSYQRGQEVFRDSKPFSYVICPRYRKVVCDFCLKKCDFEGLLLACGQCKLVYYCDQKCQREGWKSHHKLECKYLGNMPPEISDVFKENHLPEDGGNEIQMIVLKVLKTTLKLDKDGREEFFQLPDGKKRYFADLMFHCNDKSLAENRKSKSYFVYEKCRLWLGNKAPGYDKKVFRIISTWDTNSQVLLDSEKSDTMIAKALYLGASSIDHSCDPNVEVWNNGKEMIIKTTREVASLSEIRTTYLEREMLMKSSFERKKRLKERSFFVCKCSRCEDPDSDAKLMSLRCKNCPGWVDDKTKTCSSCNQKLTIPNKKLAVIEKYKQYTLPMNDPASCIKEFDSFFRKHVKTFHPFHRIFGTFSVFVYDFQTKLFTKADLDDVKKIKLMLAHCTEHFSEFSNLSGTLTRLIGLVYTNLKSYDQAEIYYKRAEEIMNVILVTGHPRVEVFQSWKSEIELVKQIRKEREQRSRSMESD